MCGNNDRSMTRKLGLSGCHSSELSADACQHAYDLCLWPFFSPIGANLRRFGGFQSAAPPNEGAPAWISEACRVPPKDWAIFKTLSMRFYIVVGVNIEPLSSLLFCASSSSSCSRCAHGRLKYRSKSLLIGIVYIYIFFSTPPLFLCSHSSYCY